jgi:hypothetical protein
LAAGQALLLELREAAVDLSEAVSAGRYLVDELCGGRALVGA